MNAMTPADLPQHCGTAPDPNPPYTPHEQARHRAELPQAVYGTIRKAKP